MWTTPVGRTIDLAGSQSVRPEPEGETTMTTAIVDHRRPWLPALNLLLAGGAAVLAVIAITTDDVGSTPPAPAPPVVAVPSANLPAEHVAVPSANFLDEVAAVDACRQARANEPC